MFPDRSVTPAHETTAIDLADGTTTHALVLKEGAQGVTVLTREGTVVELPKGKIKSRRKVKTSLMTEAMADAMNQSQWRNLLAFLTAEPPGGTLAPGSQPPAPSVQLPASRFRLPASGFPLEPGKREREAAGSGKREAGS